MLAWNCEACVANPRAFTATAYLYSSAKNTAGFVGYFNADPTTVVVSFRGTLPSSLQDWIDDLNFIKTDCESTRRAVCAAARLHAARWPSDPGLHTLAACYARYAQTTCVTGVRCMRASTSRTRRCEPSCWTRWRS